MKKILTLFLVGISLFTYAQKFQITNMDGNLYPDEQTISVTITEEDMPSGTYDIYFLVENLTADSLTVNSLLTPTLVEGMMAEVCTNNACYPGSYDIDILIKENSVMEYSFHLTPFIYIFEDTLIVIPLYGLCQFKLEFTAGDEKITLYWNINVKPLGVKELNSNNVSLSVYPNPAPANSTINVSYTVSNYNEKQNLVIRNILGSEVLRMQLNPYENKTSVDISTLKQGVYFYAIENKNQIIIAKKLIIK